MGKEKIKENLEKLIRPVVNFGSGLIVGAMDTYSTGLPLLSGGFFIYGLLNVFQVPREDWVGDFNVNKLVKAEFLYVLGASIPFGINHYDEIYNFVEGVLK